MPGIDDSIYCRVCAVSSLEDNDAIFYYRSSCRQYPSEITTQECVHVNVECSFFANFNFQSATSIVL